MSKRSMARLKSLIFGKIEKSKHVQFAVHRRHTKRPFGVHIAHNSAHIVFNSVHIAHNSVHICQQVTHSMFFIVCTMFTKMYNVINQLFVVCSGVYEVKGGKLLGKLQAS